MAQISIPITKEASVVYYMPATSFPLSETKEGDSDKEIKHIELGDPAIPEVNKIRDNNEIETFNQPTIPIKTKNSN